MASYNELNALIDAYINRNGVQAITGQILNGVLKAMVEQLGRGYTIMGAAIPTTDPGTPDGPECYFASTPGTYTDFDGLQVVPGELALLCYTPSDGWTKATIYEGFRQVGATIDGNVGTPSVGVSYADGILSFDFHNMKGNPGQNGQDGAAAGFGTIGADITGGVGTPAVSVESSGPATAKNLQFHFTNLKGETGVTSVVATVDSTSGNPSCAVSLQGQQLTLAFSGLKGAQGNTGSSVDYPFTIVNNLTTNDPTQALSAAMGVQLEGELGQLEAEVGGIDDELEMTTIVTPLTRDGRVSKLVINASGQMVTNSLTSYVVDYIVATHTMKIKVSETISGPSSSVGMFGYVDSVADIVAGTTITAKDGIYTTSGSFEGDIVVPAGKVFVISTQTSKATYSLNAIEEKSARLERYDPVVGGDRIFSGDLRNFCPVVNYGIKSATGAKDYRAGWNSSDFIRVKGGSTLKYKCYSATSYGIAFYADNTPDSYISGETATGSELTISVPATAKFFRASAYASNTTQTIEFAQEELGFTQVRTLVETLYVEYEGALEQNPFDGKAVIPSGQKILGIGASFMRGNATGDGTNNVWLHLLGNKVGCEVINDGVGGTNVMYHANRLFNGSILGNGTAPISDVSAILIMHTHNKDVFTLPEPFASYSVSDYETNVLPFSTTSGDTPLDVEYAKAFDYIIKKTKSLFYADKSATEYASGVQTYVGQYYFKPFQIVLCTHWHDARTIYNASVRKLAKKWGIPLVRFDEKIGFTRKKVNPAFGYQPSLEFVGNVGGATPYETIDGVAYGWHPMCGGTDVYIQQKLASIAKDSFDYFPE